MVATSSLAHASTRAALPKGRSFDCDDDVEQYFVSTLACTLTHTARCTRTPATTH